MTPRLNPLVEAANFTKQFIDFSKVVTGSGLEESLVHLVEIRASQINGCANCLNMHTAQARKSGEVEQRLHLLAAWREAPVFSARERAALAWTESMTSIAGRDPDDRLYEELDSHFTKEEQIKLTMVINVINGWNRLAVGFRIYDPSLGW